MKPAKHRHIRLIIAGGGTGGHLFPGIAVAQEIQRRNPKNRVLFVGTGRAIEKQLLPRFGFDHFIVSAGAIMGRSRLQQIAALVKLPRGVYQSLRLFSSFQPNVAMGVGGYSAAPVVLAAWLAGIKRVVHEQNALPGMTNRLLGRISNRVYLSIEPVRRSWCAEKEMLTGNPVRDEIIAIRNMAAAPAQNPLFTVLVLGGSQGAHRLNKIVTAALDQLQAPHTFSFIHQTGQADEARVTAAYKRRGIQAEVAAFFSDMGRRYGQADLIICRAGATTVAEITAVGKCALFVPYPYAADDHQRLNAQHLVAADAADMVLEQDITGTDLARRIQWYAANTKRLAQMARNARMMGMPNAAKQIADDVQRLIERAPDTSKEKPNAVNGCPQKKRQKRGGYVS